jgi:hypothetical protein
MKTGPHTAACARRAVGHRMQLVEIVLMASNFPGFVPRQAGTTGRDRRLAGTQGSTFILGIITAGPRGTGPATRARNLEPRNALTCSTDGTFRFKHKIRTNELLDSRKIQTLQGLNPCAGDPGRRNAAPPSARGTAQAIHKIRTNELLSPYDVSPPKPKAKEEIPTNELLDLADSRDRGDTRSRLRRPGLDTPRPRTQPRGPNVGGQSRDR